MSVQYIEGTGLCVGVYGDDGRFMVYYVVRKE